MERKTKPRCMAEEALMQAYLRAVQWKRGKKDEAKVEGNGTGTSAQQQKNNNRMNPAKKRKKNKNKGPAFRAPLHAKRSFQKPT
eukprot:jgi/Pico_ML_1/50822/g1961.t1